MTTAGRGKPPTVPTLVPVTVTLHRPLLDAVRAQFPASQDWTDSQITAACVALAVKVGNGGMTSEDEA